MAISKFSLSAILSLTDNLTNPYKKTTRKVTAMNRTLGKSFTRLNSGINKMAKILTIGIAAGAGIAATAIGLLVREASKVEDAAAAFTPLLGGVEKANELVEKLNKTAATTPFQFEDISKAAKQLLPVMNADIENTIATFRMLGDTAGGNAQKLESITRGFTKAMLKGKVDLESLNMIAEAGVPVFDQLAKELGVSTAEMFKMVTAGKVTTQALTKTFKTMTSEGGIFFKGMEIASETLTGRLSTMKDNIKLTAASLGSILLPIMKKAVIFVTDYTIKIREWITANKDLIAQKIEALLEKITTALKNARPQFEKIVEAVKSVIKIFKNMARFVKDHIELIKVLGITLLILVVAIKAVAIGIKIWTAVQWLLNSALFANPIGLIIIAVIALIAGIVLLVRNWEKVVAFLKNVWNKTVDFVVGGLKKLWNKFSELLNNPFFVAIGMLFAPWLTIPALIIKHWEPIKEFFTDLWINVIKPLIAGVANIGGKIGQFFGGDREKRRERREQETRPEIARTEVQQIRTETQRRSEERDQRHDIFLHGPAGAGISGTPGGFPQQAVQLGAQ